VQIAGRAGVFALALARQSTIKKIFTPVKHACCGAAKCVYLRGGAPSVPVQHKQTSLFNHTQLSGIAFATRCSESHNDNTMNTRFV